MTITAKPPGEIDAPNSPTAKAAGAIAIPNTKTAVAAGEISVPNSKTAVAAGTIDVPNSKAAVAAGTVAVPNNLTALGVGGFPRALLPLVAMNFAAGCYAQCHDAVVFDDLFIYSRDSTATFMNRYIDECGKNGFFLDTDYVGDVTNLMLYSEQLDDPTWSELNTTVDSNTEKAPDGSFTADKLIDNSTNGEHQLKQSVSVTSGTTYTFSVHAKAGTLQAVTLSFNAAGFGSVIKAIFDLRTGSIISITPGFESSIKLDRNGYYIVAVTAVATSTTSTDIDIETYDLVEGSTYIGFEDHIFLWGSQFTESAKPLPYVKTLGSTVLQAFTESLRLEYSPTTGLPLGALIEGGITNEIKWSEKFGDALWLKQSTGVGLNSVVTANFSEAVDRTYSADKVAFDLNGGSTSGDSSTIDQSFTPTDDGTQSVWLQSADGGTHTITLSVGGSDTIIVTPTRTRHEVSNTTSGATHFTMGLIGDTATTDTAEILVWGAQYEALSFASSYIRTEGTTDARLVDDLSIVAIGNIPALAADYSIQASLDVLGDAEAIQYGYKVQGETTRALQATDASELTTFEHGAVDSVFATVFPANTMRDIIGVVDQTNQTLFVDGVQVDQDAKGVATGTATTIDIGSSGGASSLYGHVSKLNIYGIALTPQEVSLL